MGPLKKKSKTIKNKKQRKKKNTEGKVVYLLELENMRPSRFHKTLFFLPDLILQISFFFSFFFLGHVEVPRLGVEPELQLLAHTTATANAESELHLPPTPQLMATPDRQPTE